MHKTLAIALLSSFLFAGCDAGTAAPKPSSDERQQEQQEKLLQEGTSSVGMPAIKNFREKRLLKEILELRDQDGLTTYTYIVAEQTGKLVFLCDSVGYGIPYATQYTNPAKPYAGWNRHNTEHDGLAFGTLPQADPNGLFSPAAADGTWVMCKDPNGDKVRPVFIEPRTIVSPFPMANLEGGR